MRFKEFIGNEKIKQQLTYLTEANRLPHAIVLEGAQGLGKRTLARELAQNLFCRSETDVPCGICAQCVKVKKQIHPDIYEYTASGGARSFHVDVIREVREDAFMQPNEAPYKIYILGNCQCMNASAQNALLKLLEEPPAYALFILTVTNKSALLETVLSRSVVLSLEGVQSSEAVAYITAHDAAVDIAAAQQAAETWGGNIGKAMESLQDGALTKITSLANEMVQALLKENEYALLTVCASFERDKDTLISTLTLLKTILRDVLTNSDFISSQTESVELLAKQLSKEKCLRLLEVCNNCVTEAEMNANNAILITKICYSLRQAIGR